MCNSFYIIIIVILLLVCCIVVIQSSNKTNTNIESFFEDIRYRRQTNLVKRLISYTDQWDTICDILNCTDLLDFKYPSNPYLNINIRNNYRQFTYEEDGSGCYLWIGYNDKLMNILNPPGYNVLLSPLSNDDVIPTIENLDYYKYNDVINMIDYETPVVYIYPNGDIQLLSASLIDFFRFVGTFGFDNIVNFNNLKLNDHDTNVNLILYLLSLKPISVEEFTKKLEQLI